MLEYGAMRLKSIELSGFKSFARKTVLEFGTTITAIVGPNGSGKSNVAESFRFVLGEQSMKSMRGKRGEDLIFGGSKLLPRGNRASVKLLFDNNDRMFNVDFDEVSLERVVHRDGVNDYLLNGTSVRLRDISELLAQANIGSSGHHIISQGEADRILSAPARERREMLEDALGLKAYLYKREEAERKLTKTGENMAQVESLRRELAPHLRFLERQVKKIEEVNVLRELLTEHYREYLKREELYLTHSREELADARREPEAKRREMDARITTLRSELDQAGKSGEGSSAVMALEADMRQAGDRKETLLRDLSRVEGEYAFLSRRVAELSRRAQDEDAATVPLKSVRTFLSEVGARLTAAREGGTLEALSAAIAEVLALSERFAQSVRPNEAGELPQITKEAEEKQVRIKGLELELQSAEEAEKALRTRVERMRKDMEAAQAEARDAERELFALMNKRNEVEQAILMLSSKEAMLAREEEDFKREREEGAVLIGRELLSYTEYALSASDVMSEERSVQEERRRKLEKMKIKLEGEGASSAQEVLREHQEAKERDEFLARELADLSTSAESLRALIAELTVTLSSRFSEGLGKVNAAFAEFFKVMFGGGEASLTLTRAKITRRGAPQEDDEEDTEPVEENAEYEEGIEIQVSLPHKRVKGLHMLSGGERALTSIALIFAMSQVNPPPFLILDETDAALDEANSRRYGDMIETLAGHSQLIVITHNRETMSRAGVLYGVTMGAEGASKLLSVKFEEAVVVAK